MDQQFEEQKQHFQLLNLEIQPNLPEEELDGQQTRNRNISKIDRLDDSMKFNQKKYQKERPFTHNLGQLANQNQGKSHTFVLQLRDPDSKADDFRKRIISCYQQDRQRQTSQYSWQQNQLREYDEVIQAEGKNNLDVYLPTEQDVRKQVTGQTQWRLKKSQQTNSMVLQCGGKNNKLYLKSIYSKIFQENLDPTQEQAKERMSLNYLIKNTQIADKYLNDYGLFYLLKQGLDDLNVQVSIINDSQTSNAEDEEAEFKGKAVIQSSQPRKQKLLGLPELIYFCTTYSILKFQLHFEETETLNYEKLQDNYQQQSSLINQLNNLLGRALDILKIKKEIIWLRLYSTEENTFVLEFTIPEFQDRQEYQLVEETYMLIKNKFPSFLYCMCAPIVNPIELSFSNLNPWLNREFKSEDVQSYGWRLYSLKTNDTNDKEMVGFINLFYDNDDERQNLSSLKLDNNLGIVLVKDYKIFNQKQEQFAFLRSKFIDVRVYQETRRYKVYLQVSIKEEKCILPNSGDETIDNSVFFIKEWVDLQLQGILVQEYYLS